MKQVKNGCTGSCLRQALSFLISPPTRILFTSMIKVHWFGLMITGCLGLVLF